MSDSFTRIQMASGLMGKFKAIREQANNIWILVEKAGQAEPIVAGIYISQYGPQVDSLIEVYSKSKKQFDAFTGMSLLDEVKSSDSRGGMMEGARQKVSPLEHIITNSQAAIGFLQQSSLLVSPEIKRKLDVLRESIEPLEDSELLYAHLVKAISELEYAHYLASAIIAGKVTDYLCSQLGGSYETVSDHLIQAGVLDPQLRDNYVKGLKRARNYYTHELRASPEPQEAVSLVADSCDFALKYNKMQLQSSLNP